MKVKPINIDQLNLSCSPTLSPEATPIELLSTGWSPTNEYAKTQSLSMMDISVNEQTVRKTALKLLSLSTEDLATHRKFPLDVESWVIEPASEVKVSVDKGTDVQEGLPFLPSPQSDQELLLKCHKLVGRKAKKTQSNLKLEPVRTKKRKKLLKGRRNSLLSPLSRAPRRMSQSPRVYLSSSKSPKILSPIEMSKVDIQLPLECESKLIIQTYGRGRVGYKKNKKLFPELVTSTERMKRQILKRYHSPNGSSERL